MDNDKTIKGHMASSTEQVSNGSEAGLERWTLIDPSGRQWFGNTAIKAVTASRLAKYEHLSPEEKLLAFNLDVAEDASLRADAARYRWMRNPESIWGDNWELMAAESLDAAIDAAIAQTKGQE